MQTTAPDGRSYDVRRRWSLRHLRWLVEVRDLDAVVEGGTAPVVLTEQVGRGASARARVKSLVGLIATRQLAPPRPGHLAIRRQSVAMGDDATDNTLFAPLPPGARLEELLEWLQERGPFISAGDRHTWLLREDGTEVRPLAVLDLRTPRSGPSLMHIHPVADRDHPVAVDGTLRLDYLLAQDVDATLELIARSPRGPFRLR